MRPPRSHPEGQAPLAIEPRQKCIAAIKQFQKMRFAGIRNHPTASTSEKAVLFRKLAHPLTVYDAMHRYRAETHGIMEEMVENLFDVLSKATELYHLGKTVGIGVIEIPAHNLAGIIP